MKRAADTLAVVAVSVVLVAGCSTGSSARRASTTASTAVSTTTTTRPGTTTTVPPVTYRMNPGDSLTAIASRFGVSVAAIAKRNHIANPDHVAAGRILVIPPAPPLTLVVTPIRGEPGQAFHLELRGAKPSETVRFEIESSAGKYMGGPHTASAAGEVNATYQTAFNDATGIHNVTATGSMGTKVRAGFRVVAPTPSNT